MTELKELSNIQSIKFVRNRFYEIYFEYGTKYGHETARGEKERKEFINSLPADAIVRPTEITFYEFTIYFNDGTSPKDFSVGKTRLEEFYSNSITLPYGDFRDQIFYCYHALHYLKLNLAAGTFKHLEIQVPLQILKDGITELEAMPLPEDTSSSTLVKEITEDVVNFWKPLVNFNWGEGAYELFLENQNRSASYDKTLSDLVDHVHTMAKNYSKNQNEPFYLNIFKEDDKNFLWSIQDKTYRRVFNGGIIWHADYVDNQITESGHYSIHT